MLLDSILPPKGFYLFWEGNFYNQAGFRLSSQSSHLLQLHRILWWKRRWKTNLDVLFVHISPLIGTFNKLLKGMVEPCTQITRIPLKNCSNKKHGEKKQAKSWGRNGPQTKSMWTGLLKRGISNSVEVVVFSRPTLAGQVAQARRVFL